MTGIGGVIDGMGRNIVVLLALAYVVVVVVVKELCVWEGRVYVNNSMLNLAFNSLFTYVNLVSGAKCIYR